MAFDLPATLRRLKPAKSSGPLRRRKESSLSFVAEDTTSTPLLLDTTVYIDRLTDRLPGMVSEFLNKCVINHSSIAMAEFAHPFGRLDPEHENTQSTLEAIEASFSLIPSHRISAPSPQAMIEAGIVTGVVARRLTLPKTEFQPMLNDAILFLQALEIGSILLTRNSKDLDFIQQIVPAGRVLFYRQI